MLTISHDTSSHWTIIILCNRGLYDADARARLQVAICKISCVISIGQFRKVWGTSDGCALSYIRVVLEVDITACEGFQSRIANYTAKARGGTASALYLHLAILTWSSGLIHALVASSEHVTLPYQEEKDLVHLCSYLMTVYHDPHICIEMSRLTENLSFCGRKSSLSLMFHSRHVEVKMWKSRYS